jgi:nuclease S1
VKLFSVISAYLVALALAIAASTPLLAWGVQGHRLVGTIAANHLSTIAKRNVAWLLAPETLGDVASWADEVQGGITQTSPWHYVNIPPDAKSYDRDRDCPRQPGVAAGARNDVWRDCIVDRIRYHEERLADTKLDRADRATALKFLVHFVGDVHQPLHASAIERGGNGILVRVFGSDTCGSDPARQSPCNLHGAWDSLLIAHRGLDDRAFAAVLERRVRDGGLLSKPVGTPAEWAMESLILSNAILLPQQGSVDEAYYMKHIGTIEQRLALAGARLAQVLNRALATPPPP